MKILSIIVVLIFIFIFAITTYANPPSAMYVDYDSAKQWLNVSVQHPVSDPKKHLIKTVTVFKNGQEVETRNFDFQTSHRDQTMTPFKIAAKSGDKFKVVANCNKFGSGEKEIAVK